LLYSYQTQADAILRSRNEATGSMATRNWLVKAELYFAAMAQPPLPSGWSAGDAALIAASGAVLAATIAFFGALIGSTINAWSARRVARDAARRQLLTDRFQPYAKKIGQRIRTCHRVMTVGSRMGSIVAVSPGRKLTETELEELKKLVQELVALSRRINMDHISDYDPAMLAHGDQRLIDANTLWIDAISTFTRRAGEFDFDGIKQAELGELQDMVFKASVNGAIVLAVMQEVIIGRSWRHKQIYRLKRKLGWAKIEI
jgi:hypothetical protein